MRHLLSRGNVMELSFLKSSVLGAHACTRTLLPGFGRHGRFKAMRHSIYSFQQKQSLSHNPPFSSSTRNISGKARPRPEKQEQKYNQETLLSRKEPSSSPIKQLKQNSEGRHADSSRSRRSTPSLTQERGRGRIPPVMEVRRRLAAAPADSATGLRKEPIDLPASSRKKSASLSIDVPRADGITDGPWKPSDRALVKKAESEAKTLASAPGRTLERTSSGVRKLLLGMSEEDLEALVQDFGEQKYRGRQLHQFIYKQRRHDLAGLLQLPGKLREGLVAEGWSIGRSPVHHIERAKDGTAKILLRLHDDRLVEAVGIPKEKDEGGVERLTACVSSQVGCPLRCTFCATGKGGFARNLVAGEIVAQVLALEELFGERVSNVVFMGMGEPMLNLPNVIPAQRSLNQDLGIGQRMMTLSTVGVPNTILRLAEYRLQSTLAVSLHAPNQALREKLVPSAKAYPLQALMADCQAYFAATHRRVSFEYTLLAGVNDSASHAAELAALLRQHNLAHHVNVIPYNPVDEGPYQRPSRNAVMAFVDVLTSKKVTCSVRQTRGLEANAACGQLRNAFQKDPIPLESP